MMNALHLPAQAAVGVIQSDASVVGSGLDTALESILDFFNLPVLCRPFDGSRCASRSVDLLEDLWLYASRSLGSCYL